MLRRTTTLGTRRVVALPALIGAVAAVLAATASPTAGAATCPPPPTSLKPFLAWGDANDYVLTTGGSFEKGSPAWTLSAGAKIVAGTAPNPSAASGSAQSLYLPVGSSATSACVTAPKIIGIVRFFAKNVGAADGRLQVEILVKGSVYQAGTIGAGSTWAPSPMLVSDAPAYKGAVTYQVRLTPIGAGAALTVDDVYFDPYRSI
jgi:hypothetical protein